MKESEPEGDENDEVPKSTMLTSLNRSFKDKIKKRIGDKLSESGQSSSRVHHKEGI
jgi:hypothetical protein